MPWQVSNGTPERLERGRSLASKHDCAQTNRLTTTDVVSATDRFPALAGPRQAVRAKESFIVLARAEGVLSGCLDLSGPYMCVFG